MTFEQLQNDQKIIEADLEAALKKNRRDKALRVLMLIQNNYPDKVQYNIGAEWVKTEHFTINTSDEHFTVDLLEQSFILKCNSMLMYTVTTHSDSKGVSCRLEDGVEIEFIWEIKRGMKDAD